MGSKPSERGVGSNQYQTKPQCRHLDPKQVEKASNVAKAVFSLSEDSLVDNLHEQEITAEHVLDGLARTDTSLSNAWGDSESYRAKLDAVELYGNFDEVLLVLSSDKDWRVRKQVAGSPFATDSVLRNLSEDPVAAIRQSVADNPNTSDLTFENLSQDVHKGVRLTVAANPNTPAHVLEWLSGDADSGIRMAVAEHQSSSSSTLVYLTDDPHPPVRRKVSTNYATPIASLRKLARDEDWKTARTAERALERRK